MLTVSERDGSITFKVKVQPRAKRSELAGEHGGALKVRLAAPPVNGKANDECRRFLASLFQVAPGAIEFVAGSASREKVIRVHGVGLDRMRGVLGLLNVGSDSSNR